MDLSNAYELLYSLTIIEYLIEGENNDSEPVEGTEVGELSNNNTLVEKNSPSIIDQLTEETENNWREEFIKLGGFNHLLKIFKSVSST